MILCIHCIISFHVAKQNTDYYYRISSHFIYYNLLPQWRLYSSVVMSYIHLLRCIHSTGLLRRLVRVTVGMCLRPFSPDVPSPICSQVRRQSDVQSRYLIFGVGSFYKKQSQFGTVPFWLLSSINNCGSVLTLTAYRGIVSNMSEIHQIPFGSWALPGSVGD